MKKNIVLFAAAILFSMVVWADPVQESPLAHDNEAVDVTSSLKVIPQMRHEKDPKTYSTYDISYPQITGNTLSSAAKKFNKVVTAIVEEEVKKFKDSVKKDLPHMNILPEEVRQNTYRMDYDIDVIHPGKNAIISVRFSIEGMQAGRAHPFHQHRALNFDLGQNKILKLSDLFHHNVNYLPVIANYSAQKLNEPLALDKKNLPKEILKMREAMIKEGTKAQEKNYKNWNIESDGILITFDEYQVAPYAEGAPEAEIPFTALKEILSTKTSLNACIKNPSLCGEKRQV
jgi:hypothetical protein